jgi:zinc protease
MDDVKGFFRRYYVPNNASLTIAGDIRPAEARRLVEKYFGPIPRGPEITRPSAQQPRFDREVRLQEEDSVALPRVYMAWHAVPAYGADDAALDMLGSVLSSGKGSRLYKRLVYEQQAAQDASAFNNSRELAGTFQIAATAKPGRQIADLEKMLDEEVARIKAAPPSPEEMGARLQRAGGVFHLRHPDGSGEGRSAETPTTSTAIVPSTSPKTSRATAA